MLMKLIPVANFIKLFQCNFSHYQYIALSFDSGYAASSINHANKSCTKSTPFAKFIKLFCHNLQRHQCIALNLDSGYNY